MSTPVVMPQLGESVTEGTVTRWLKQVGDQVEADEPLLEVSTDKVDTEIPAPASGVLTEISANEDDIVEVGGMLATIGSAADEAATSSAPPATPPATPPAAPTPATPPSAPPPGGAAFSAPPPAAPAFAAPDPTSPPAEAAADAPAPPATSGSAATGTEVRLPELGESVTEGTVTRWLKSVGDSVAVDEPLLEISTDKVDTEIPSPVAGTLLRIAADTDDTVEVGGVLAVVGDAGAAPVAEDPTAEPAPAAEPATPPEPAPQPPAQAQPQPQPATAPEPAAVVPPEPAASPASPASASESAAASVPYVTPLVRKLASQHDVDLTTVVGSGIGGRIRRQDVMAVAQEQQAAAEATAATAATAASAAPAAGSAPTTPAAPDSAATGGDPTKRGTTEPMSRLRKVIAQRMVESLQTSAQLTTVIEADVTRIAALREQAKDAFQQREGVKLTFLPFFAKAVAEALKAHPTINASIDQTAGEITYHGAEHLGIAVDTDRGLLVPVIRDAGDLNIAGLARRITDLAERTRTNHVTPDELSGGTFTLTNTGSRGALFDTPILNQPQVAILGTGAVVKRPVVMVTAEGSDVIAVRSMMYLALTYDHRIVDGADAARFLGAIKTRLETGAFDGELGG